MNGVFRVIQRSTPPVNYTAFPLLSVKLALVLMCEIPASLYFRIRVKVFELATREEINLQFKKNSVSKFKKSLKKKDLKVGGALHSVPFFSTIF